MAYISRTADPIFNFFFFLNAQNFIWNRLYRVKFSTSPIVFFRKTRKTNFQTWQPWNWQNCKILTWWKKRTPDSDSATQNYMKTTGFASGKFWLLTCVIKAKKLKNQKADKVNKLYIMFFFIIFLSLFHFVHYSSWYFEMETVKKIKWD